VIGTIDSVRSPPRGHRPGGRSAFGRLLAPSEVADFRFLTRFDVPDARAKELAHLSTRLKKLDAAMQERLVNWGYAICDTAMRRHVEPGTPRPATLPYPETPI
jgi:NTE family protein